MKSTRGRRSLKSTRGLGKLKSVMGDGEPEIYEGGWGMGKTQSDVKSMIGLWSMAHNIISLQLFFLVRPIAGLTKSRLHTSRDTLAGGAVELLFKYFTD